MILNIADIIKGIIHTNFGIDTNKICLPIANSDLNSNSDDIRNKWTLCTGYVQDSVIYFEDFETNVFSSLNDDNIISIVPFGGNSNPKWLLDEYRFHVMAQGVSTNETTNTDGKVNDLLNALSIISHTLNGMHSKKINKDYVFNDKDSNLFCSYNYHDCHKLVSIVQKESLIYYGRGMNDNPTGSTRPRASITLCATIEPLPFSFIPMGSEEPITYDIRKPLS